MPTSLLPTLLLQILVIGYSPGPANIYTLTMTIKYGKVPALRTWVGLLCGYSLAAIATAVITHFIGIAFGQYVVYLKYLGAAYLLYLSYKLYHSSSRKATADHTCSFLSGMIVQMTNAKMLLFELTAYSTFVLPYTNSVLSLLEVAAWLALAGPGGNIVWLLAGSYLRPFFTNYKRQVDICSAIAILLCAIYIVIY